MHYSRGSNEELISSMTKNFKPTMTAHKVHTAQCPWRHCRFSKRQCNWQFVYNLSWFAFCLYAVIVIIFFCLCSGGISFDLYVNINNIDQNKKIKKRKNRRKQKQIEIKSLYFSSTGNQYEYASNKNK